MLKMPSSVKAIEREAAQALAALLRDVPSIKLRTLSEPVAKYGIDLLARVDINGRLLSLAIECKLSGQPRHARMALQQLRHYVDRVDRKAIPMFIAPYLSPHVQSMCREHNVSYLDLQGNARLVSKGLFVERVIDGRRDPAVRRELKSIFKPRSAQVLRVLLREPQRSWRVADLAEAAQVSLGHISNVRSALVDREWARVGHEGLRLTAPDDLLDAWRDAYEPPQGERLSFYTALHGKALEQAVRNGLAAANCSGKAMWASFSAAQWLAPYLRAGTEFFYTDQRGFDELHRALQLVSSCDGENVWITRLSDSGIFQDAIRPAAGVVCTSAVQTYLDMACSGERGREAAEHLRREKLKWRA